MEPHFVGASHEFHNPEFVIGWAEKFAPNSARRALFDLILTELQSRIPDDGSIIELGIGPGYLARHILDAMPDVAYTGVDFSLPMFDIARARLAPHAARVTTLQADLVDEDWPSQIMPPVHAVVSTWTLHDLGSQENVHAVYAKCARTLGTHGVLLNGDFIKPDGTIHEFEGGRFAVTRHLEMLADIGFGDVACLALFEEEIHTPTSAQNYACFRALK